MSKPRWIVIPNHNAQLQVMLFNSIQKLANAFLQPKQ